MIEEVIKHTFFGKAQISTDVVKAFLGNKTFRWEGKTYRVLTAKVTPDNHIMAELKLA